MWTENACGSVEHCDRKIVSIIGHNFFLHKSQIKNTFHLILDNKFSIHKCSKKSKFHEAN